jgi:hypothetical protein
MATEYKLVCDYDGTVDFTGSYREVSPHVKSFEIGDYTLDGTVYRRVRMPWNSSKVVGSREFRRRNLRLFLLLKVSDESTARLLESWTLLFPQLWEPTRGFDYIAYYNTSTYTEKTGEVERPQASNTTLFNTGVANHAWYFGSYTGKFEEMDVYLATNGVAGTYVWEYSDGDDSWTTLTPVTNGNWTSSAKISWTAPNDWVAVNDTNLENDTPLYLIRCRNTVSPTTAPIAYFIKRHRPISLYLMESTDGGSTWEFWNRTYASDAYYPNGWCIESCDRLLIAGQPNEFQLRLNLMEANE